MCIKKIVIIAIVLWCVSVPDKAIGEVFNQLTDVKLQVFKGYSRIVLCVAKRTSYKVIPDFSDKTLTIEIPHSSLKLRHPVSKLAGGMVEEVVLGSRPSGSVYVDIKLPSSSVEFTHFLYHNPSMIVVNIREDKRKVVSKSGMKRPLETLTKVSDPSLKNEKPVSMDMERDDTPAERNVVADRNDNVDAKPQGSQQMAFENRKEQDAHTGTVSPAKSEARDIFETGIALFEEDNYSSALENFASLVVRYPNSSYAEKAAFLIGDCYFEMAAKDLSGKYNPAIGAYTSAQRLYPDSESGERATFQIGESYWRMGYLYEAEAGFMSLIDRYPESEHVPQSQLNLALIKSRNGNFKEAIKRFRRFLVDYPDNNLSKGAVFGIADAYHGLRDFKSARRHYEEAMKHWPDYPKTHSEILFGMGETYFQNKKYQKALESFLGFINIFPKDDLRSSALTKIGDSLQAQGKTREALIFYSEVVSQHLQDREVAKARISMADLGMERPGLSLPDSIFDYSSYLMPQSTYNDIYLRFPNSELGNIALFKEGLFYLNQERYDETISTFKRLYEKVLTGPSRWKAYFYVQNTCIKEIDLNYKEKDFFSVLKRYQENLDPFLRDVVDAKTLSQVGESYRQLGLYGKAREIWQRALHENPEGRYADAITFKIGDTYLLECNYKEAEGVFRRFVNMFPKSPYMIDVLTDLGDTLYRSGDFQKAVDVYLSTIDKYKGRLQGSQSRYFLAHSLEKLGYNSKAVDAYKDVILSFKTVNGKTEDLPDFVMESYIRMAGFLYDDRLYSEALNAYMETKNLIKKDSRGMWVSLQTANCYRNLVREEEAIQTLEGLINDSDSGFWRRVAAHTIDDINWKRRNKDRL